jgi:hypothetical protein
MDSEQIQALLEKYWNCETSLDEEKILRNYFNQAQVPSELKDAAALFQYFGEQRKTSPYDTNFDTQIKNTLQPKQGKVRSLISNSLKIAAGISVVVASVWLVRTELQKSETNEITDTYDDPKQAFEETKKALQMISKNFGRAQKATANINLINDAKEKVNQTEEKVDS